MVIFHCHVAVYQRVPSPFQWISRWFPGEWQHPGSFCLERGPLGHWVRPGVNQKVGPWFFLQPFCWDLSWDIYIYIYIYIYNPQVRWKHVHIELIEAYELWMKLMNESYGRNWCPVSGWILPLSLARRWLLRALLETLELVLRQARSIFLDPAVDHHLAIF